MPTPRQKRAFQEQMEQNRAANYRRMQTDARPVFDRLQSAYSGRAEQINRIVKDWSQETLAESSTGRLRERIQAELKLMEGPITDAAKMLENSGVEQGVRAGASALRRGGMSVGFNQQTIEGIRAEVGYVDSPAWRAAIGQFSDYHAGQIADIALSDFAMGKGPRQAAADMRRYLMENKLPLIDAERMARTTHLYASREGTRQIYQQNGVLWWVWSANLGNARTCLACVALHGTVHPINETCNDHHNGRCAATPLTPKWEDLGFQGGQDLPIESGIDWFNRQPENVQRQYMGPKWYTAYQSGQIDLSKVPGTYQNAVFGEMRRKNSLQDVISGGGLPGMAPSAPYQPMLPILGPKRPGRQEQSYTLIDLGGTHEQGTPIPARQ